MPAPTPPADLSPQLHHWYRSVIAHPEGALVHDGDCNFYWTRAAICTCGLLHALNRFDLDYLRLHYPGFATEHLTHMDSLALLTLRDI